MYGNPWVFFILSHPFYAKLSWETCDSQNPSGFVHVWPLLVFKKIILEMLGPVHMIRCFRIRFSGTLWDPSDSKQPSEGKRCCYHYVFSCLIFPIGRSNCECSLCLEAVYSTEMPLITLLLFICVGEKRCENAWRSRNVVIWISFYRA